MGTYDRDALLGAVLAQLEGHPTLAPLQSDRFPDSFEEWLATRLKSPRGAYLLAYAGSRRTPGGESTSPLVVAFDVVLVARATGPHGEALISAVEEQLDGHRIALPDGSVFDVFVESDAFTSEGDRVLVYAVRCRADLL